MGSKVSAEPLLKSTIDGPPEDASFVGSPMKKQRASLAETDADNIIRRLGTGMTGNIGEILGSGNNDHHKTDSVGSNGMHHFGGAIAKKEPEDEEL